MLRHDLYAVRGARTGVTFRWKAKYGTPLRADLRALATWRGEAPRIALRNYHNHPMWSTYKTHPPLPYAPSPLAELDHWLDLVPGNSVTTRAVSSNRRARRRAVRPHLLEVQHWCFLAGATLSAWERAATQRHLAVERLRAEPCRAVVTHSRGLVKHFEQFLAADVWPKLDYVFPACPSQPEEEESNGEDFTILSIARRLSDKGIPEALRAFEILRRRHGPRVRMVLVSGAVPRGYRLPEGVVVHDTLLMSPALKATLYRSADVLVEPVYSEAVFDFPEACSFGVPTVATRLHHGDDFVRDGESGYLIDSPLSAYTEEYGRRWRSWPDFMAEIEQMRECGELAGVVDELVDRLELMVSASVDVNQLHAGARRLHAERFSPEVRNAKLNAIYARALRQ